MSGVKRVEQVKMSNITFSELKKQARGGYVSYINLKEDSGKSGKLLLQTPQLFCPFGASYYRQDGAPADEKPKYTVRLSLDEKVAQVSQLKSLLNQMDEAVCTKACKNRKWLQQLGLGKKKGDNKMSTVEVLYNSIVKPSAKEEYPDAINLKVPVDWSGNKDFAMSLYDKTKNEINLTYDNIEQYLPKLCELKTIIHVSHVWFVGKKFGITIKLLQAMVYPKETISGYAFLGNDDAEESEEEEEEEQEKEEEEEEEEEEEVEEEEEEEVEFESEDDE